MLRARDLSGAVTVDAVDYKWKLLREPQWCTADGYRGMAIAVELADQPGRTAILNFPFPRSKPHTNPLTKNVGKIRPQIQRAQLEAGVLKALAQGWDPTSKGQPVEVEL